MEAQDRKNEIVKAAGACFSRYGYEKTTLDDIGKSVGLNKASLYYYYRSKESIYAEVIFNEAKAFLSGVLAEVGKASGYKEKILSYLVQRFRFIKNAVNLKQLSTDSVRKIAPLINTMYNQLIDKEVDALSEILEKSVAGKEIAVCDTRRVANGILTVAEAVRSRIDCTLSTEEKYGEILDEVRFTVSLILDGLAKA
jgi:Transcriptional regulator